MTKDRWSLPPRWNVELTPSSRSNGSLPVKAQLGYLPDTGEGDDT